MDQQGFVPASVVKMHSEEKHGSDSSDSSSSSSSDEEQKDGRGEEQTDAAKDLGRPNTIKKRQEQIEDQYVLMTYCYFISNI